MIAITIGSLSCLSYLPYVLVNIDDLDPEILETKTDPMRNAHHFLT